MPSGTVAARAQSAARPGTAVRRRGGAGRGWAFALLGVTLGVAGAAAWGTGYAWRSGNAVPPPSVALEIPEDAKALKKLESSLTARKNKLATQLERKAPRGVYIVIDQTQNQLFLRKDDEVLREAVCSAGSGMVLKNPKGGEWTFDTPRGAFRVLSKMENPVWKKPDWAFVEEGKPIPKDPSERIEPGSLGEYALYFGNGYLIHGTLYERFLRRSVSHGCIRVGRDDLREVYRVAGIGTPIYIY
jgi:L,D-transpeptidase YbiS